MKNLILTIFVFAGCICAQDKLSGNLQLDSKIGFDETYVFGDEDNNLNIPSKKSTVLAGLLSFAVPGAGEFYTENYIKSAIFLAVEAASIVTAIINDKKGDDQTESFEKYANDNWDVKRYANWTITNAQNINPEITDVNNYNVFDNNGNVDWDELNRLESAIGGYYSHRLAPNQHQQYFEMIGKYPQFNVGWNDFGDDPFKPFKYGDPVTPNFEYYSGERGKANDFYNTASTAVKIIVANHLISAIDAVWSANRYNKNLSMKLNIEKFNLGNDYIVYPNLNVKFNF